MNDSEKASNADISSSILDSNPMPPVDAEIKVAVSRSGLEASINIKAPQNGGSAPTYEAMMAALSSYNITYNINKDELKALEAAPVYDCDIVIARGTAPIDGLDGTASLRIRTHKGDGKPREKENGTVDYRDLDIVENVSKGQVLCVISPPTEGSPGISVRGEPLQQRKGRPVHSYVGSNTVMSEDGSAILSRVDGQVEFSGDKINVSETYYVKGDVDVSTGNIAVNGNLVISGMVTTGFVVQASKSIDIKGVVENSTIKSNGNISLQSGITGSEIHCGGDLKCRFLENCTAFVRGNLVAGAIVKSDITCGKNIKVSGAIARIVGGNYAAGQNIEAHIIGSRAYVETKLELGADYTLIKRQQELMTKTNDLQNQIEKLRPLLTLLRQYEASNRLTPEKQEVLEKAVYSFEVNMQLLKEANAELDSIQKAIESKGLGRIICTGSLFPGTKVMIGQAILDIKDPIENSALYYHDGDVCVGAI